MTVLSQNGAWMMWPST